MLTTRIPPPNGGLYRPAQFQRAIRHAQTELKSTALRAVKLTPQYLQIITANGQAITVDAEGRSFDFTAPLRPPITTFPISLIRATLPARLIALTQHTPGAIAYLQLSGNPTSHKPVWDIRPTHGTTLWQANATGTDLWTIQLPKIRHGSSRPSKHAYKRRKT